MNPLNQAQLDKMTPEKRAKALAAIARHNTPEAKSRHYEAIEAVDREVRETGGITTADGVLHPCRIPEAPDPRLAAVGRALRERRTAAGLSLDDVARESGVERSAVAKLERGANPNPTVATLDRVMHALGGRLRIGFEADEPSTA